MGESRREEDSVSKIEWCDVTWNPVVGCSRVSKGCEHCFAERMAHRLSHMPQTAERYAGLTTKGTSGVRWTGKVRLVPEVLEKPLRWRKPRRIFVNSMSDLFHKDVPDEFIQHVFGVMAGARQHTFQVLTKRPERMRAWFEMLDAERDQCGRATEPRWTCVNGVESLLERDVQPDSEATWPLPNVHLGVSCENQDALLARWPDLAQTPAAVRFISAEPLLGPLDFNEAGSLGAESGDPCWPWSALKGYDGCDPPVPGIDHVIVGGESGPGARPCNVEWIRSIVQQCRVSGVPVFVKQLGAKPAGWCVNRLLFSEEESAEAGDGYCDHYESGEGRDCGGRCYMLKHPKGADMAEWPEDLRVQEMPAEGRRG